MVRNRIVQKFCGENYGELSELNVIYQHLSCQVQLRNFDSVINNNLCILSCAKDNIGPSQA